MVPYVFAMRLMTQANANPTPAHDSMTCETPCKNCSCDSVYSSDYVELDASPMTTQAVQFIEGLRATVPVDFWARFCEAAENASAAECKIYED